MNYKAHVTVGALTGIGISYGLKQLHSDLSPVIITVSCFLGATLPDIDHPKSHLGRRFRITSKIINETFGHRTLTHSLAFCFGMGYLMMKWNVSVGVGTFFGILSHILLDMLTPFSKGVALFYPIRKRIGLFKA